MQKFPDQRSNPHHSSNPGHSNDNARSLTCWATRAYQGKSIVGVLVKSGGSRKLEFIASRSRQSKSQKRTFFKKTSKGTESDLAPAFWKISAGLVSKDNLGNGERAQHLRFPQRRSGEGAKGE